MSTLTHRARFRPQTADNWADRGRIRPAAPWMDSEKGLAIRRWLSYQCRVSLLPEKPTEPPVGHCHQPAMIPDPENFRRAKSNGFALVITLSLMVLLTLLAVGLLTLSAVSLRTSAQGNAMVEARGHARLALMLALNQLQKTAGQDQRITAPADLAGDTGGVRLAAGKGPVNTKSINNVANGLTAVLPGTRYWTGVWETVTTTAPATQIYTKTPGASNVKWLISGNETNAATNNHTPASALAGVAGNGAVANPASAAILVGRNTVGAPADETLDSYVAAPMVGIEIDGKGGKSRGRYAWWIGDEGVKARIDLPLAARDPATYASLVPQRRGWETVADCKGYPGPDDPQAGKIPSTVTLGELKLLLADTTGGNPVPRLFHSATADSMGVITDPLNGGTRIDLARLLAEGLPSSSAEKSILNYPVTKTNIIPTTVARSIKAPKWDALKDFRDRYNSLKGGSLIVKAGNPSGGTATIAPVITEFRILMGVRYVPSGSGFKANPCGKIAVAIANPYPYPLKWEQNLEFEVLVSKISGSNNLPSRIWALGSNTVYLPNTPAEEAVFNQAVFIIKPGSLPPGEARAYTLAGATLRARGTGAQRVTADLTPFGPSGSDFKNRIELESQGVWTPASPANEVFPAGGLEVREGTGTCMVDLEMRTGSSQKLRTIERFELDTGYRFLENTIRPTGAECQRKVDPVSLLCYSFQLSRPGVDYLTLMPTAPVAYEMGMRCSTLRTFMDFNLQATSFRKPITSYNPPPFFMQPNSAFADLDSGASGGETGLVFTRNLLANPLPWGHSPNGPKATVLFSVPAQLISLAQFQHADLTGDDVQGSVSHQPGYAFANSYATPFVKRALTSQIRTDYNYTGGSSWNAYDQTKPTYYDISYLLNAALWDTYFLAVTAANIGSDQVANPALVPYPTAASLQSGPAGTEAGSLLLNGAFNINCTDPTAWKAFLAATRHFKHRADTAPQENAAYPRTLEQLAPAATPATGKSDDSFAGFRRLTDAELELLSIEITKQVRLRGPFVSLAHFVNRALADLSKQPALTRCGALQAAIDEAGININFEGTRKGLSGIDAKKDLLNLSEKNGAPRADCDRDDTAYHPIELDPSQPDWAATSDGFNYGTVASIVADRAMLSGRLKREQGYRSTAIPGWLTQADVLQAIGPVIAARSDTFRIRTCGEALSADGKTVLARAWCEAIVQRVPEFIDPADPPFARLANLKSELNKRFGRRFTLTSFRWLSANEI